MKLQLQSDTIECNFCEGTGLIVEDENYSYECCHCEGIGRVENNAILLDPKPYFLTTAAYEINFEKGLE
jgi:hypothetical protein